MKFDFCIGNPPYQEDTVGDQKSFTPPVYHEFLDAGRNVADRVLMIHPARFLFNAGATPKAWNKKMLNDSHFKVLDFEVNSKKFFENNDIKGGIAITYADIFSDFGKIGVFSIYRELRSIVQKVWSKADKSLCDIILASEAYKFSDEMHADYPNIKWDDVSKSGVLSKGHDYDLKSSVLTKLQDILFFDNVPNDGFSYVAIWGTVKSTRSLKYIKKSYLNPADNFEKYKVLVPSANGSGALGEVLSTPLVGQPLVGQPLVGHTQSFISIGAFDSEIEANNCLKYVKSKFTRCMLGVLKVTQSNNKATWAKVPMQDFTDASDIDWSKSIPEIDQQLYAKYGLNADEIAFIETKVKEMV